MPTLRPPRKPAPASAATPLADETCTKAQLIDAVFERAGLEKPDARRAVEAFFALIAQRLALGEDVKLTGFGSFQTRSKGERPGRNPRTGEPVPVTARRVVTFHASGKLKARLQD